MAQAERTALSEAEYLVREAAASTKSELVFWRGRRDGRRFTAAQYDHGKHHSDPGQPARGAPLCEGSARGASAEPAIEIVVGKPSYEVNVAA